MSYSTYMYIHNWKRIDKDKIEEHLKKARDVFELGIKYNLSTGYWDKTEKDYRSFGDYILETTLGHVKKKDYQDESIFVFCNHDGETDEEVLRCFVEYAKILSKILFMTTITISSDVEEDFFWLITNDIGCHKIKLTEELYSKFNKDLDKVFAKYELIEAKKKLKDAQVEYDKLEKKVSSDSTQANPKKDLSPNEK